MRHSFQKDVVKVFRQDTKEFSKDSKSLQMGLPFEAISGKEQEAKDAIDAFGKTQFELPMKKISSELLFSVGEWTPIELQHLEPILQMLSVVS